MADGRQSSAQRALNELDKLVGMVVQEVSKPNINYRGDRARFAEVLQGFHLAVRSAGLSLEFPWGSLDEAEGAMKSQASGPGSYALRRDGVRTAVAPLRQALEAVRAQEDVVLLRLNRKTWQLGAPLRAGGFARVYEAVADDGTPVVAKLIPKEPGADRELLFEDLRGARNVVPILDYGEHGEHWVLIMPRAQHSLGDRLRLSGPLSVADAMIVLRDVAEALEDIRGKVVHRDIKPDNILLLAGRWSLADFGIARYAEASTSANTRKYALTPEYAAPEQWSMEHATSAADVYALGATIFEAISGKPPFQGPSFEDFRAQHMHAEPPSLAAAPPSLGSLLAECLFKAPGGRPTPTQILARAARVPAVPAGSGLGALQQANLEEVQRTARDEVDRARAETELERRERLFDAATTTFDQIVSDLAEAIANAASAARLVRGTRQLRISLGDGALVIDDYLSTETDGWPGGPFDVICRASITVTQPANFAGYTGRSHSLWYADAQEEGTYLWFETAFMTSPLLTSGVRNEDPFWLPPNAAAHQAISPGITPFQVAWPFTPLIVGSLDAWIGEWAERLAMASQRAMQIPSQMPERYPVGSWRTT